MRMKLRMNWICRMRLCFILGSKLLYLILMRLFLWGCCCLIFGVFCQGGRCIFGWIRCWGIGDFYIGFIMRVWAAWLHAAISSHRALLKSLPDNSLSHSIAKVTLFFSQNSVIFIRFLLLKLSLYPFQLIFCRLRNQHG